LFSTPYSARKKDGRDLSILVETDGGRGRRARSDNETEFLRPKKKVSCTVHPPARERKDLKCTKKLPVDPVTTVRDNLRKLSRNETEFIFGGYHQGHECTVKVLFFF
jgi:hypothetical protein